MRPHTDFDERPTMPTTSTPRRFSLRVALASTLTAAALTTVAAPAFAGQYDACEPTAPCWDTSLNNPANPASPLNLNHPANPGSALSPLSPLNPANPMHPYQLQPSI
ncbi:hypothetical protein ACFVMC_12240 [Nocardia sp. NPDC127579]|uniref:hypothetical protein n=1 Tax=Nocardia sp. NPDC127579 TaxID=3345402 RepID=UPI00362D4F46